MANKFFYYVFNTCPMMANRLVETEHFCMDMMKRFDSEAEAIAFCESMADALVAENESIYEKSYISEDDKFKGVQVADLECRVIACYVIFASRTFFAGGGMLR